MHWRIVGFHTVLPEERAKFASQIEMFRVMGFQFCSMTEGLEKLRLGGPGRWMTITFDDGDLSVQRHGQAVLDHYGIKAIQYITTDYIQQGSRYRDKPSPPTCTWDDLRSWIQAGHEVGSHTHTHPSMIELPLYRKEEELEKSITLLREKLGQARYHFAYPYGRYDPDTRDLLNRASWVLSAVTTDRGWNREVADQYALRRDILESKWSVGKARVWLWRGAIVGNVFEQNTIKTHARTFSSDDKKTLQAESFRAREGSLLERMAHRFRWRRLDPKIREYLRSLFYEILWWQSWGQGLVNSLPGREIVRIHPRYRYTSCNLEEYYAFREAVRSGDVALDVGANVGFYTILLAQWVGERGRVYALEPVPAVFQALCRHVSLNGVVDRVQCRQIAASESTGQQHMLVTPFIGINRLVGPEEKALDQQHFSVAAMTLDEFCHQENVTPRFIKIDVEGHELSVLRGARGVIRRAGSGLALFAELHPSLWPELGISQEDIKKELNEQGLKLEPLTPQVDPWQTEGICSRLVPIQQRAD
jgi:FkbM family methyltransferase